MNLFPIKMENKRSDYTDFLQKNNHFLLDKPTCRCYAFIIVQLQTTVDSTE